MKQQIIIATLLISSCTANGMDQKTPEFSSSLEASRRSKRLQRNESPDRMQQTAQSTDQNTTIQSANNKSPLSDEEREQKFITHVGAAVFFGSMAVVSYVLLAATHSSN